MSRYPSSYSHCMLCPRRCGVNRTVAASGYCRSGDQPRLASAVLHRGEEPPLVTGAGSGALFFSGCTLGCTSCQNCQISTGSGSAGNVANMGATMGTELSIDELARIMLRLQGRGASNINIVTGTHFAPSIIDAVALARSDGLSLPIVWNTSGYERIETLEALADTVDIWLPDLKTFDAQVARDLMHAKEYPRLAREALLWMVSHAPLQFDGKIMTSGTICRHLVLPGLLDVSQEVFRWFADTIGDCALLSVLVQYIPGNTQGPHPAREIHRSEYEAVLAMLERYGIDTGYVQELEDGTEWIPDFIRVNPFPPEYADPLWHWREGYVETDSGTFCRVYV